MTSGMKELHKRLCRYEFSRNDVQEFESDGKDKRSVYSMVSTCCGSMTAVKLDLNNEDGPGRPRIISLQVVAQFGLVPTVGYVGMYQRSIHGSFRLLCRLTYYSYVQRIWRATKNCGTVFFVVDTSH